MPAFEVRDLFQRAVLWPFLGQFDEHGQHMVSLEAVDEIPVRWNDVHKEALDRDGNSVAINAEVVVQQPVPIGSNLWLGRLIDLPRPGLLPPSNVMVVISTTKTPDMKNRNQRQTLSLMRLKDQLSSPY